MSLKNDLRTYLIAQAAISGKVSSRMHWLKAPQDEKATHIVYQHPSGQPTNTASGAAGLIESQFVVLCKSQSEVDADALGGSADDELNGFSGTMGSTFVRSVLATGQSDGFESFDDGSEDGWYVSAMTLSIWHT